MPREAQFIPPSTIDSQKFVFRRMHGLEELGRLPSYEVELIATGDAVDPDDILGKVAAVELKVNLAADDSSAVKRYFSGVVTSFELDGVEGEFDLYRLMLRPWLWFLTQSSDCRVFQKKTVVEIVKAVFADYSPASVKENLTATYEPREYCVQYRESDFAFVSRLMESEGIFYYFEHTASDHTLVLCDGGAPLDPALGKATLNWHTAQFGTGAGDADEVALRFRRTRSVQTTDFVHKDYDHELPSSDLSATSTRPVKHSKPSRLKVYEYPGGHDDVWVSDEWTGNSQTGKKKTKGQRLADMRRDAYKARADVATGLTQGRSIQVGRTFKMCNHPVEDNNVNFKVTHTEIWAEFGTDEGAVGQSTGGFQCRFDAIPAANAYQPVAYTPVPVVAGSQSAIVVGGSGDEILTEKMGRVKVQFQWDHLGSGNNESSCWVRVCQPWASNKFGFIALPRVGDEVIVEFLDGNPDRPIIVGSVYNGTNMPPYALPDHATVSGLLTRSSKEGDASTANELRFDDAKGKEYIWFQAQKDYNQLVKNDAYVVVKNDAWHKTEGNQSHVISKKLEMEVGDVTKLHLKADANATLDADCNAEIKGALNLKVDDKAAVDLAQACALSVGQALDLNVGQAAKLTAGAAISISGLGIVIDGQTQLTIKAGGSFIVLGPDGVSIQGAMVKINSGGSAGSAQSAQQASPAAPKDTDKPKDQKDPLAQ